MSTELKESVVEWDNQQEEIVARKEFLRAKNEAKAIKSLPKAKKWHGWFIVSNLFSIPIALLFALSVVGIAKLTEKDPLDFIKGAAGAAVAAIILSLVSFIAWIFFAVMAWFNLTDLKNKTEDIESGDFAGLSDLARKIRITFVFNGISLLLSFLIGWGFIIGLICFIIHTIFYFQLRSYYNKRDFNRVKELLSAG